MYLIGHCTTTEVTSLSRESDFYETLLVESLNLDTGSFFGKLLLLLLSIPKRGGTFHADHGYLRIGLRAVYVVSINDATSGQVGSLPTSTMVTIPYITHGHYSTDSPFLPSLLVTF